MNKVLQIYKQILQELEDEKKLARSMNRKNVKMGEDLDIRNYDHNNK